MKISNIILKECGFKQEKVNEFFHIEMEAKGFTLRWLESLKGYYLEPTNYPTARIEIKTLFDLKIAFELITDKPLFIV